MPFLVPTLDAADPLDPPSGSIFIYTYKCNSSNWHRRVNWIILKVRTLNVLVLVGILIVKIVLVLDRHVTA